MDGEGERAAISALIAGYQLSGISNQGRGWRPFLLSASSGPFAVSFSLFLTRRPLANNFGVASLEGDRVLPGCL